MLSVHVVGAHIDVTTFPNDVETGLVVIGIASEMNLQDLGTDCPTLLRGLRRARVGVFRMNMKAPV